MRNFALKNLFNYVYYNKSRVKLNLRQNLVYCAMAGRVCYSRELDWNDKRLNEDIVPYLDKLSKWTHYSVFAHIPVEIIISNRDFMELELFNLFKSYYDKNNEVLYLNLRHILEAFNTMNIGNISNVITTFENSKVDYFKPRTIKELEYTYSNNVCYFKINDYWDFYYLKEIDRVSSHQIVRHQALNFNQQSQRYVKLKNIRIPSVVFDSIKEKYENRYIDDNSNYSLFDAYINHYHLGTVSYEVLLENGMASEDARGVLPSASPTNMVISGFNKDIDKFINDRLDNKAQSYIREIASNMKIAKEKWGK